MTSSSVESPSRGGSSDGPTPSTGSQGPTTPIRTSLTADNHGRRFDQAGVNENSPLLSPASNGSEQHAFLGERVSSPEPDEFQTTKSLWYLLVLTIGIGGLQIAWSVELSNGSPYLLSLGLSKSLMALVWIAGPLSGTLVQPYVGMLSDNCRIAWGKRKPFMVAGSAATIISLMFLAWTRDIVRGFLGLFGADPESQGVKVTTIVVAVIWVYILDFAINTVQAALRAFIVDCCPAHQQESANAMASRLTGIGNIFGYVAGYINLPSIMWWLGDTQFKDLCAIASVALAATVLMSCLLIKERDPRLEAPKATKTSPGVLAFFVTLMTSIKNLPPQIKKVCIVQVCAWVGFFPMLFYTSSFIGEIYVQPYLRENPHMTPKEIDELYERATRVGTFALLIFSVTSLLTNIFLPFLIAPTYDSQPIGEAPGEGPATPFRHYGDEKKSWSEHLVIPGFTLRRAWLLSQLLFMGSMLCTVIVRTVPAATVLVGLVGITWALTLWAPWAIISAEISRKDALIRQKRRVMQQAAAAGSSSERRPGFDGYSSDQNHKLDGSEDEAGQAGVILGIHNMAIAAPQIIATVGSSIIFKIFQKPRGTPGDHSIAIVMAIGGFSVGASAWFIHLINDEAPETLADDMASDAEEGGLSIPGSPIASRDRRSVEQVARPSLERSSTVVRSRVSLDRARIIRSKSYSGMDYA
ncbi:General alpha-glucoside permease [Cytospora mali]|uniref:General alpha-glucoside permease n=1 Tax=Cytospora mali TaxID=578113 RepID=A0A194V6E1_CYTMA|nr:General alpha-glucoside permease [Valsa mali var. pyri (nom. inval.)]